MATEGESKPEGTTTIIIVVALAAVLYFYSRSKTQSAAMAGATVSNPAARAMGAVANTSSGVLTKAGLPGRVVSKAINGPVQNVESGNVRGTLISAATGGLSDVWDAF